MTDRSSFRSRSPRRRLAALALAGAVLAWQAPALANFQEGVEAFARGDYFTAWRELQKAAERDNNVTAKFYLGWMYENGRGVPKDESEAASWYLEAAQQGDVKAMNNLGSMYRDGRGVAKDAREAVRWFKSAAEAGHATAQVNLGLQYEQGSGVPKDARQAVHWYHEAAQQGRVTGQFNLALMYHQGRGVAQDMEEAARWYRMAAERGHATAQLLLARLYEAGSGVPQSEAEALKLYRSAAEAGHPEALFRLAEMQETGSGAEQDLAAAAVNYGKAAESGFGPAQAAYGRMLEDGTGVAQDRAAALEWFKKAAEQGEPYAQFALGQRYLDGDGVERSEDLALDLYRKAAEHGQLQAQLGAAAILERRAGGLSPAAENAKEIATLYQMAAEQGDVAAQIKMGRIYTDGIGVEPDPDKAAEWMGTVEATGDMEDRHLIARFWLDRGEKLDEAETTMAELFEGHPARADFAATLGKIKLAKGDTTEGLELLDRAFRLDSDNPAFSAGLGDAFEQADRLRDARRYWMASLARADRDSDLRDQLIMKLEETAEVSQSDEYNLLTARDVQETQELLSQLGFDPGPADGVLGKRTREALKEVQAWLGIEASGKLSGPLLEAMRIMDPIPQPEPEPEPFPVENYAGQGDDPTSRGQNGGGPAGIQAPVRPADAPTGDRVPMARRQLDAEILFWQSIISSDNPEDFRAYLQSFPDGIYVPLARNRLRKLEESAASGSAATE